MVMMFFLELNPKIFFNFWFGLEDMKDTSKLGRDLIGLPVLSLSSTVSSIITNQ